MISVKSIVFLDGNNNITSDKETYFDKDGKWNYVLDHWLCEVNIDGVDGLVVLKHMNTHLEIHNFVGQSYAEVIEVPVWFYSQGDSKTMYGGMDFDTIDKFIIEALQWC